MYTASESRLRPAALMLLWWLLLFRFFVLQTQHHESRLLIFLFGFFFMIFRHAASRLTPSTRSALIWCSSLRLAWSLWLWMWLLSGWSAKRLVLIYLLYWYKSTNTANTAKLIAVVMNVTSFGLIGKTSATTFQVVGHSKTCLVLSLLALLVQKYTYWRDRLCSDYCGGVCVLPTGLFFYDGSEKHRRLVDSNTGNGAVRPHQGTYQTLVASKASYTGSWRPHSNTGNGAVRPHQGISFPSSA